MKKQLIVIALVLSVFSVYSNEPQTKPILLCLEETRFKSSLITEMKTNLENQGYAVTVLDHSKKEFQDVDPSDYSAVFITNSGVNSKVRPWVVEWVNKYENNNILVHTTQAKNWKVELRVDAVTSASKKSLVKTLANDYVSKLLDIIKLQQSEK